MTQLSREKLKSVLYEGPQPWLWFIGISRIAVLILTMIGAYHLCLYRDLVFVLLGLYGLGLMTSLLYLVALFRQQRIPPLMTWTQVLVDFALVAVTLGFTGGVYSFFTFLVVIVILEAGLLLGLPQGFVFATMATVYIAVQSLFPSWPPNTPIQWIELGYRFLIQSMAFYLTAFVSGYWNQLVTRMEQFHRRILDNMNSGFLMTDHAGIVTFLNRAACSILDVSPENATGQPVQEILKSPSGAECPVQTVLRCGRDYINYEFQTITPLQKVRVLEMTTSRMQASKRASGKKSGGVIVAFSDQTAVNDMRQELQKQDRLAAVGELAAGVAHEIRNPVAAIRGAMDELRGEIKSPELLGKLANIALRESDRLNEIVTDFLEFARNPELRREAIDLREIAVDVKESLSRQFCRGNGHKMVTILPDISCRISADHAQLKLAMLNLGENAFEAMKGKGTLTLTVAPVNGSYEIRFEDEGPGVPPEKISRIFEPFYTEKERAVGMGLATCMRIVTAHDGTIRVASRNGGGASFIVRVPAAMEKKE